jgi:hypothetical protein
MLEKTVPSSCCQNCHRILDVFAARSRQWPDALFCSPCARAEAHALFQRTTPSAVA